MYTFCTFCVPKKCAFFRWQWIIRFKVGEVECTLCTFCVPKKCAFFRWQWIIRFKVGEVKCTLCTFRNSKKKLTKKTTLPTTPLPALYLLYLCSLTDSRKMVSTSRFCNQPIKSRPGQRCTNLAKYDVKGVKCCGKHINFIVDKRSLPPPTFGPFNCSICMDQCGKVRDSCTTICNHRFHKACLSKWEESAVKGGKIFTCPLCRNELQSKIAKSIANDEPLRFRLQLEELMESMRALNQENTDATLAHLDYLINHVGMDAVAVAVDGIITRLSNNLQA